MLQAKDIMVTKVISVKKDTPIYEAIEMLRKNHISSMPVVEDDLTLLGILSEKDVISLFCYAHKDDKEKVVSDFMSVSPIYFMEDDSLLSVCDYLIVHSFKSVPITSKGKVVGIISQADIIDCILHLNEEDDIELVEQPYMKGE